MGTEDAWIGPRLLDWQRRLLQPHNRALPRGAPVPWLNEAFFTTHWAREPTVLRGPDVPADDWPRVVTEVASALPERARLQTPRGREPLASRDPLVLLAAQGHQLLAVADVHPVLPFAAALVDGLRQHFGCPVTSGLYLNGPGAPGFPEHHDAHHVFALQLHGEKTWFVGTPTVLHPSRRYDELGPDAPDLAPLTVHTGQLLYLPPGTRHHAEPGSTSVHLSLGIHGPTQLDALQAALEELGRSLPALRTPLAHSELGFTFDRDALAAQLRDAADALDRVPAALPLADGAVLRAPIPEPLDAWPVIAGRFVPHPAPLPNPALQQAQQLADHLHTLPGVVAVAARGSVLRDTAHRADVDLLVLTEGEVQLPSLTPGVLWDLRSFTVQDVLQDRIPFHLRLALAVEAHWLAGSPPWAPLSIRADAETGRRLQTEASPQWTAGVQRLYRTRGPNGFDPHGVAWVQKRALRGVLPHAVPFQRYTRHPAGCVALIGALFPEHHEAAQAVLADLFASDGSPAAVGRAMELGSVWIP